MFGWLGKVDTSDGHTHQVYSGRDGNLTVYASDAPIRGCGTVEARDCQSLDDVVERLESSGSTVTGIRRD